MLGARKRGRGRAVRLVLANAPMRGPGRSVAAVLSGGIVVFAALFACGSCGSPRTPMPPMTPHPTSALVEVPYPPPPARVETVPEPPKDDAVWVDGEWVWQGGRWAWRAGRWVVVPPGVAFAPWTTVRASNGVLYAAEGVFRDAKGNAIPEPAPLASGRPRGGAVVDPEGDTVPATPPAAPTTPDSGPGTLSPGGSSGATGTLPPALTTAGAFVDSGLLPGPPGRSFPDSGPPPGDASALPDAFVRVRDASALEDAMPVRPLHGEAR